MTIHDDNEPVNRSLEFNDGIGDYLREKESHEFSWKKTIGVLLLGALTVILFTIGGLKMVGHFFFNDFESFYRDDYTKNMNHIDQFSTSPQSNAMSLTWSESDSLNTHDRTVSPSGESSTNPETSIKRGSSIKSGSSTNPGASPQTVPPPAERTPATEPVPSSASSSIGGAVSRSAVGVAVRRLAPAVVDPSPPTGVMYRVIVGTFSNESAAKRQLRRIQSFGYDGYIWQTIPDQPPGYYKVQLGSFGSLDVANTIIKQLKTAHGIDAYIMPYRPKG